MITALKKAHYGINYPFEYSSIIDNSHQGTYPLREGEVYDKEVEKEVKKKMKEIKKEKEKEPWAPSGSNKETLESISLFKDFIDEDGKKMSKKLIRESFDALDDWIDSVAMEYQEEFKEKEDKLLS